MYLKYGSYQHDDNEVSVAIDKRVEFSGQGVPLRLREVWTIDGFAIESSVSALTTKLNALTAAYATSGYDLELYESGGTRTSHYIDSSVTTTGTMVTTPPSFPEGGGVEYTTHRSYRIVVEAVSEAPTGNSLVSYSESISIIGNSGPLWRYQPVLNGPPQKQVIYPITPITIVQRGRATGKAAYPTFPSAVAPAALHGEQFEQTKEQPGDSVDRSISWNYVMEVLSSGGFNPGVL